jgi:hypothetical protein
MFSIAPSCTDFDALLEYVKNPKNRVALLSNPKEYDAKEAYSSFIPNELYLREGCDHASALHKMLNAAIQLAVCHKFHEFTRQNVVEFIAHFNTVLEPEPSFETITVTTNTFGKEALRILNRMRHVITKMWQKVDRTMLEPLFV